MISNGLEHVVRIRLRTFSGDGACTGGMVDVLWRHSFNWYSYPENSQNSIEQTELWHLQRCSRCLSCSMALMNGREVSSITQILNPVVASWAE
jgi:hypothetical protein